MKEASAFAPCHITGVFHVFNESTNALYVGSTGAGVSLSLGAKTTVKIKEGKGCGLRVNINQVSQGQVSRYIVNAFLSRLGEVKTEVVVEHQIEVPIGVGLGTSGAAALSLALALNEALCLNMPRTEAAQLAHVAEIKCKTGLGTVIAETYGGLEVRVKPGAPGIGEIKNLPVPENALVACHVFGPLFTRKLLSNSEILTRINTFRDDLATELTETSGINSFMKISREFAEHVGLITKKVRVLLDAAEKVDVVCSMPMFGESVFTITDEDNVDMLLKIFREFGPGGKTFVSKIDLEGARLLK
jgi:pantoate kinase